MQTAPFEVQSPDRKPVKLAMQSLWLTGRIVPTGALLRVHHEFSVDGRKKVESIYCFGLPRDAALRRFQIRTESLTANSDLRPTEEAIQEYERGIAAGSLSAMARQYGDGLVNLSVGNIRPGEVVTVDLEIVAGVELTDAGLRLRFPFTLAPSYHGKAKPVSPEPGWGEIELPSSEFGDIILPRWAADARGLHRIGFDLELSLGASVNKVASPSHRILSEHNRVALASRSDLPDRDLVLDLEASGTRILAGTAPGGTRHMTAVIPSTGFATEIATPRNVVLLIDSSGSMHGAPIDQARSAALACVAALEPRDNFGIALFSDDTVVWKDELAPATKHNRDAAARFLDSCSADGGTELGPAIHRAADLFGDSPGEVLLFTDGEVFGGETVLKTARQSGIRIHALGIGSASQDRMLSLLARETGGVSRFVTPRERVDQAALLMFSAAGRAIASGIVATLKGTLLVPPAERAYLGTPISCMGRLEPASDSTLQLQWNESGGKGRTFTPGECSAADAEILRLLEGARRLTDLDCRLSAEPRGTNSHRRVLNALRELSAEYGLASREMSLVAVIRRKDDVGGDVPHTMIVPVGLPEDMSMRHIFSGNEILGSFVSVCSAEPEFSRAPTARRPLLLVKDVPDQSSAPDPVVQLATLLEDDGGMPGSDMHHRIQNSVIALEVFLAAGSAFAPHARRLTAFLQGQPLDSGEAARFRAIQAGGSVCKNSATTAASLLRTVSPYPV